MSFEPIISEMDLSYDSRYKVRQSLGTQYYTDCSCIVPLCKASCRYVTDCIFMFFRTLSYLMLMNDLFWMSSQEASHIL